MINSSEMERPKLVLIVDDQELNRDALESILEEDEGYNFIFAENGKEAMDLIREHQNDLSIVLLDLIMPVMTGFEVLKALRADEQLKDIPVIVLTAEKQAELEALDLGAVDFITKPFDVPDVIVKRVDRMIKLREGQHLIRSAEKDPLTGLYSSNFFFEYANRLYTNSSEKHDAIVLNIEQFHTVNALNGRDFGDEVLRTIGDEIGIFLTETEGLAGRIEADRFDIYCLPQPDYLALLERIQDRANTISPNVSIHLRMGVKPYREGVAPVLMFDRARAACSMVRGNYQKPLMIYDEDMRMQELLNQRLLNDLRTAAEERQLIVFYQPKYDIQCDPPRLSSAEALVRWNHPEMGLVSPGSFVPLFEGNGLIGIVDSFVWQEAARQIREWRDKYHFTLPVSVNLSRSDVMDPTLIDRLVNLVVSNNLEFRTLKLEVTESAYTENAQHMLDVIRKLRSLGFEIEMDDFGSGYSSLNMLSDMPIDVLKMDMKFIRNIEENETDRRLVSLILDIARYLRVSVVAEGVETKGQLEILRAGECDLVQGYYFSKPLPPEEFEKLIQKEIAIERN